ncbi:MAG: hypothetical protein LIV29_03815 [Denitrobacterium sp.]|nr:hypothetical protein [Denitrobacterium sp.]
MAEVTRNAVDFAARWLKSHILRSAMAGVFRAGFARDSLTWCFTNSVSDNGRGPLDSARLKTAFLPVSASGIENRPHICPSAPTFARIVLERTPHPGHDANLRTPSATLAPRLDRTRNLAHSPTLSLACA